MRAWMLSARMLTPLTVAGVSLLVASGCGNDRKGFGQVPPGGGSGGSGQAGMTAGSSTGGGDMGTGGGGTDDTTGGSMEPPIITDPTGLQWFDADLAFDFEGGQTLCDDALVGGFDDWRLPRIQEHLSVVLGCELQSSGGCLLEDPGCLDQLCGEPTSSCPTCPSAPGDCFFDATIWGTDCATHRVYWSGSVCTDCGGSVYWAYDFGTASPLPLDSSALGSIRCVR